MDAINETTDDMMKYGDFDEGKPRIGIEFDSEEDTIVFYNGYAKSKGFGTFKGLAYMSIKKFMVTT